MCTQTFSLHEQLEHGHLRGFYHYNLHHKESIDVSFYHHELFRRRRLRGSPGPITIALHPRLKDDEKLYLHTLVHELLHAAGLVDHGNQHSELVNEIAPAPKLSESPVLRSMREEVLAGLPEQSWICGECGHTWERRRVSLPQRCPKCARPFSSR